MVRRLQKRHAVAAIAQAQSQRQAQQPTADNAEMLARIRRLTYSVAAATSLALPSSTCWSTISYSSLQFSHPTAGPWSIAVSSHFINGSPQRQTQPIERAGLPITR